MAYSNPHHLFNRMNHLMNRFFRIPALALPAAALLVAVACGGDDALTPSRSLGAGLITCEQLHAASYQYGVQVDLDVGPLPTIEPKPTGVGPSPFHFTTIVDNGRVQNGGRIAASIHNTDGGNRADYEAIQWDDDTAYLKLTTEEPWQEADTSTRPIPFPYWPKGLCDALGPDIDTTTLGTPVIEDVRGATSEKYEINDLSSEFFRRAPDFGGGSDAAGLIEVIDGAIWISERGRYPTKFEITGTGQYGSGQLFTVTIVYEVWDMGADIKIEQPPLSTQAG